MKKRILSALLGAALCLSLAGPAFAKYVYVPGAGPQWVPDSTTTPAPNTPSTPTQPSTPSGGQGSFLPIPTPTVAPSYSVSAPASPDNGAVSLDKQNAKQGDTVTITVSPDEGYEADTVKVVDAQGNEVAVTENADGTYSFTMPASKVSVEASFKAAAPVAPAVTFPDVPANAYYAGAVDWAVAKGVTTGTGDGSVFSPDMPCTRAQIVTFLWRAVNKPDASGGSFTDVPSGAYYEKAVAWAVANKVTTGTDDAGTSFSPDMVCTRAQIATFLWRAAGSPEPESSVNPFTDVKAGAYYEKAVLWCVEQGITLGTNTEGTVFSPDASCTRAQIVTFLYRAYA